MNQARQILVIDDEQGIRENIVDLLEAEDYQGIEAPSGEIGVEKAIECHPDLIL